MMDKRREVATHESRPERRGGEWRILVALSALTLLAVAGLYVIARDKPSSGVDSPDALPVPAITTADACANFADYWMFDSGVGVDASVVQGLTNCWQSSSGEWFVPTSPRDLRLPEGYALTQDERLASNSLRQELLREIEQLETTLSNSIETDLERIYDPRVRPISGHLKDGESISRQRSRYTRVVQAYLLDPEHQTLADYVAWLMADRIEAYDALIAACSADSSLAYLRNVCYGVEDSMSVRFPPWPWDLRNSVSLEGDLAYLVRTNQLPDAGSAISAAPAFVYSAVYRSSWGRVVR